MTYDTSLTYETLLLIVSGGFAGGFVTGLAGFGTGLAALVFWLQVLLPIIAAPLVVICSIVGQLQTLPKMTIFFFSYEIFETNRFKKRN